MNDLDNYTEEKVPFKFTEKDTGLVVDGYKVTITHQKYLWKLYEYHFGGHRFCTIKISSKCTHCGLETQMFIENGFFKMRQYVGGRYSGKSSYLEFPYKPCSEIQELLNIQDILE